MATVNQSSLRSEFDALKARFESLCAEGKMSAESRALVDALLMLFELLMAVFMEKHTPKGSANSSLPASQSPHDWRIGKTTHRSALPASIASTAHPLNGAGSLSIEPRHCPQKQRAGSRFERACSLAVNNAGSSDRRRRRCASVGVGAGASQRVSTMLSCGRQPSRIADPSPPRGSCGRASRTTLVPSSIST